jgi:cytochrome c oxidase subunit II
MDISQGKDPMQSIKPSWAFIIIAGLLFIGGGVLVMLTRPLILPPQASIQSQQTDNLTSIVLLIGGFVFFLVQGLLLYSVIRFRARANETGDGVNFHGNTLLEIVWTIIPSLVVLFLAIVSYQVWDTNRRAESAQNFVNGQAIGVQAVGYRYAWAFNYTTNDVVTADDGTTSSAIIENGNLHVYVGQNVHITMNARDVIHSFWIPAMRVKQDLIPGRETEIRFTPIATASGFEFRRDDTGGEVQLTPEQARLSAADARAQGLGDRYTKYPLRCTELCGSGHGQMIAEVFVYEDEEAYLNNFYSPAVFALQNPPDDIALLGRSVIDTYPCKSCHVLDSISGWAGITGPALNGIANRADARVGGLGAIDYIIQSIHLPNEYLVAGYAGGQMPYFGYSETAPAGQSPYNIMPEEDLLAIVAFLCTQTDTGNPADTDCGIAFNEDGSSVDPALTREIIQPIADTYKALYGQ